MNSLETFKEISIGELSKEALIQQLVDAGIRFNTYAEILFAHDSFLACPQLEKATLIKVRLSDLRLKAPCSLDDILGRAKILGLRDCPLVLGAFLRLKYLDQPEGPYLTIASLRPQSAETYPTGFYLRNFENALWLRGYRSTGESEWPTDNEFVFLK